ncbi:transporter [candidate division LCP-89 bacterium B3_LCP]|uniref:Transporter n=1 Tax=candidate division LCP-89 bacterium B3_LCP TaxID=2012998 RepID=A0A532UZF5_UNCL8|nr:MAG: transporter [candidate division LCP-89 bacterium B3_LCP]
MVNKYSTMESIRDILLQSEPLLLFLVIGCGFLLGQVKIGSFKLGVAGVLFAGLIFGAWCPEGEQSFKIAHQVMQIGLILFVYTVGLTSGAGFFASLKRQGLRFNLALVIALFCGGALTLMFGYLMHLQAGQIAGVFCGSLTNTPALAAVTELISNSGVGDPRDPIVGYSMTYPFGIVGGMLAFQLFAWVYRKPAHRERIAAETRSKERADLKSACFGVTNPEIIDKAIGELRIQEKMGLIISRYRHSQNTTVPTKYTVLYEGDIVKVVGVEADLRKAEGYFGVESNANLDEVGGAITMRRILVSRKELAGKTIQQLELDHYFNAQITRLRRADVDIVPDYHTRIELGDRVRVVMPSERSAEVAEFFGDSERSISELDYTALTLGIFIGVLVGMIPIPIPGGAAVSLGFAGGPLVAGLILGKLGRTGPLVWSLPAESNNALRHIGLLFFLAAVGVMAGGRFFQALSGTGGQLFLLGLLTTTVTTGITLLLLRYFGKATIIETIGATSGMQTQPATLARAYEMSNSDDTYIAYATTYPVAMVGKIFIAQLLLIIANLMIH